MACQTEQRVHQSRQRTGKGTTFRVYLPRYTAQTVETEREAAAKTAINRGGTVLVVEDEPSLQVIAKGCWKD